MIMPFGKWKGYDLKNIPKSYLSWIRENLDLSYSLESEIDDILNPPDPPFPIILRDVIMPNDAASIYRALAKKWHPDTGGSKEAMQALNEFYELLKSTVIEMETFK